MEKIYVYEPTFPQQSLGKRASLILDLPKSAPNLRGYLDIANPHAVNNLLVAYLGSQEILLACCDDGDVISYYVEHINSAIERRSEPDYPDPELADDIRPFFTANVEKSAWGLAVHTQARKIAVSANTHSVTVFAFALSEQERDELDSVALETESQSISADAFAELVEDAQQKPTNANRVKGRTHDQKYVLRGLGHNLPCVTFNNTGEDPEGRWLACGNIAGVIYTWDLHNLVTTEFSRIEYCRATTSPFATCPCDPTRTMFPHAIWGLHWLNERGFRVLPGEHAQKVFEKSQNQSQPQSQTRIRPAAQPIDSSFQRDVVPDASSIWSRHTWYGDRSSSQTEDEEVLDSEDQGIGVFSDELVDLLDPDVSDGEVDSDQEQAETSSAYESELTDSDTEDDIEELDSPDSNLQQVSRRSGRRRPLRKIPKFNRDIRHPTFPTSPFLTISIHDIFLQQPRTAAQHALGEGTNNPHPILGMHQPFRQTLYSPSEAAREHANHVGAILSRVDRMSLSVSIPELSIVIIATPKGRALVLNLAQSPVDTPALSRSTTTGHRKNLCYYRLEWLLPFKSQEDRGRRPETVLVGLAAGPVQGMLGPGLEGRKRRWRVLLTYLDGSVLSYEIGGAEDGRAGVEDAEGVLF